MNRTQLTETGITVVILVLLYEFIISLIQLVFSLFVNTLTQMPEAFPFILGMIFPAVLYLMLIYILTMYRKSIAQWINRKTTSDPTQIISITPGSVLHIALIIISFLMIIQELPVVIQLLIESFKPKQGYDSLEGGFIQDSFIDAQFWSSVIKVFIALIILLLSKKISAIWFKKKPAE